MYTFRCVYRYNLAVAPVRAAGDMEPSAPIATEMARTYSEPGRRALSRSAHWPT